MRRTQGVRGSGCGLAGVLLRVAALALAAPQLYVLPARLTSKEYLRSFSTPANFRSSRSTVVGLQGYKRYHANDSLIGQDVECSHQEKICFSFNMLYERDLDCCIALKYRDAKFSSNHLVPVARKLYSDGCAGFVMAFDDRCYRKEVVRDVICGCDAQPTRHFLHGMECRCARPVPIPVEQPKREGQCRIPDLRFPVEDRSYYYQNPYERIQGFTSNQKFVKEWDVFPRFNCFPEQMHCFAQEKVWVEEEAACFPLLERGPCPEEHVVALDVQAALEGHVEATCVHVRGGCPPGHVRMLFDGGCHSEEDIKLLVNGHVIRNQFGLFVPARVPPWYYEFKPKMLRGMRKGEQPVCAVFLKAAFSDDRYSLSLKLTAFSRRYEVINDPPLPE